MRQARLVRMVVQTWRAVRALAPAHQIIIGQTGHGEASYELRASGARIHVRHRSRDLDIVNEIFVAGSYVPPADLGLSGPLRILDLGGNVGLFGAYALHTWDVSELVSYEPDPENSRLLRLTAAPFAQWRAVEAAVSNRTGDMQFTAGMHSESRMALAGERSITVTVVDLYEQPSADLIKVDIEGGEWPILTDPRLVRLGARAIVMEWHQLGCPERDARACAERLLREAGYRWQHHIASPSSANGTVWAARIGT